MYIFVFIVYMQIYIHKYICLSIHKTDIYVSINYMPVCIAIDIFMYETIKAEIRNLQQICRNLL